WVPLEQLRGQPQLAANRAHLVLIERFHRLHDTPALDELLDAGHAVVMSLDDRRFGRAARLDRVWVNGALPQDPILVQQVARLDHALLDAHKLLADDVTL